MQRYEKSEIRKGMRMELDAHGVGPVFPHSTPPRGPVRYGDDIPPAPDFKSITNRLEQARKRLELIARDVRNARRH